jgi:hypothetical protein
MLCPSVHGRYGPVPDICARQKGRSAAPLLLGLICSRMSPGYPVSPFLAGHFESLRDLPADG